MRRLASLSVIAFLGLVPACTDDEGPRSSGGQSGGEGGDGPLGGNPSGHGSTGSVHASGNGSGANGSGGSGAGDSGSGAHGAGDSGAGANGSGGDDGGGVLGGDPLNDGLLGGAVGDDGVVGGRLLGDGEGGLLGGGLLGTGSAGVASLDCTSWVSSAAVTSAENGALCSAAGVGVDTCAAEDLEKLVDSDLQSYASVTYTAGALDPTLGGSVEIAVKLPATVPANQVVALRVAFPASLVQAGLQNGLTISTYVGDTLQESRSAKQLVEFDLVNDTTVGDGEGHVGFVNAKAYDRLVVGVDSSLADANATSSEVRLFGLCTGGTIKAAE